MKKPSPSLHQPITAAVSRTMSTPTSPAPQPVHAIHTGTNHVLALIESEVQAHTAAAQREIVVLRAAFAGAQAQLEHANAHIDHLRVVLAMFGVTSGRDGEVAGYDKEWVWLSDALKSAEKEEEEEQAGPKSDPDAEDERSAVSLRSAGEDPMRDLARVRALLERRQARAKRWKDKFIEMEKERDELKKAMGHELDELQRQLQVLTGLSQSPHKSN
jgi:hypothetical protein